MNQSKKKTLICKRNEKLVIPYDEIELKLEYFDWNAEHLREYTWFFAQIAHFCRYNLSSLIIMATRIRIILWLKSTKRNILINSQSWTRKISAPHSTFNILYVFIQRSLLGIITFFFFSEGKQNSVFRII